MGIPGVQVRTLGTAIGTSSDGEGNFTLRLRPGQYTLQFASVGFEAIDRPVSVRAENRFQSINVRLNAAQHSLREVSVVGSRNLNRSVMDSPSPIDLISLQEIAPKVAQVDLGQAMQYIAPSYNATRQTGSDGADHVDPATLRGLGPDQTLVLINGKRRHQSSLVNIFGTRGRGNTGTDLNTIPIAAIERIEILRDGAAAQYGSDAIAGVVNIVLKKTTGEFTSNLSYGAHKAAYRFDNKAMDGGNLSLNANYGVQLGQDGFLNITADVNNRNHTQRANVGPDVVRRQYGDAQINNTSLWANMELPIDGNTLFYSFGGLTLRQGEAYAWTRFANSDRNIKSIYPNGFDPLITSNIADVGLTTGVRTEWNSWGVDVANTYGSNRFAYGVENTLNVSLGAQSPTSFDAGGFLLRQNVTGVHFTRDFQRSIHIAAGTEFRAENYRIFAGEEASYKSYDPSRAPGSQGFPGFQPANAINRYRTNLGVYADIETDVTPTFMVGTAARFEYYNDFGPTLNWKLSSWFKATDKVLLRGTISTGFRAPSLAQVYFNQTVTNFFDGKPVEVLLARNDSPVTRKLGIAPLKQETSLNSSLGLTTHLAPNLKLTADAYWVRVRDRVVLTGAFTAQDPTIGADLRALGVGQAQFFTNAISTTTRGLDVVLQHGTLIGNGRLTTTLTANFNKLRIGNVQTNDRLRGKEETYFDERERRFVEASAPPSKINLTADYSRKRWSLLARFVRFGQVTLANFNIYEANFAQRGLIAYDVYKPRLTTDFSASVQVTNNVRLTVGANNLFNVYPGSRSGVFARQADYFSPSLTESGGAWDPVQMGSNGAFWFAKIGMKF
ncbi:MAG: TonB-dependent receptor [Cytophagales bacterium]|nr:MAG: TonB-dependent receptor [Cytophagales bacterium]